MPTQADKITETFQEEKEDDNPYYQPIPPINTTQTPTHPCKQEERLNRIEKDQEKLNKRQDDTIENIDKKLNLIWTAIKEGDSTNTKYIFMMVGVFIGAFISIIVIFK
jgi:hypothetical protein